MTTEFEREPADCEAFRTALALIRDRAKGTSAERWIEDSAAIHSIAFSALKESVPSHDPR